MTAISARLSTHVGPAFADARVHDAMRVGVVTCQPSTSLADAARTMRGYGIHCLIVAAITSGQRTRSWGMVDALDVARAEARLEVGISLDSRRNHAAPCPPKAVDRHPYCHCLPVRSPRRSSRMRIVAGSGPSRSPSR
jgi:hypothetical protein